MSRTRRLLICSILTKEDLDPFIATYQIPSEFSPCLPDPDDLADCTLESIVLYTLSFSICGVGYPLSTFKVAFLKNYGIHFSQLHPLAFMRIVHFELSCVAVFGEPSVPLFRMFYRLQSDVDWFTFAKRKDIISLPHYPFMPTSTYPKEWKNRFIFVSASLIPESPLLRDPKAVIDDSVPTLSAKETVLWKRMYEYPTRAFNFPEGILAMGGLSPLYLVRPKAYCEKKEMSLWSLLRADCMGVSFVVGGMVNPDMGNVLEGKTPDVGSFIAVGEVEEAPRRELRVLKTPPL
ncbi:hypothetical protein HanRHA438_Chr03g0116651 [Helianthus annuus]|uniref:Transposase (putative) gypsy type domain-containing protein n=1 Tax=Helianthus annuus TaxID=4232 RepID=A0A9K3JFH5_HELAN|nr:hypothetical protein HanXRQr2_Chr03g0105921 [Helianthus annuus]KAJ0592711.1 hypothetical protein HanHA300_Chr03g0088331 [Helianthus annuus]KAJ0600357.1 hypothetical protein HanIR_Chr03g0115681 [Helianthus annuus]KAJ0607710.1 hypothetical protein HanHA89_Chr03g0099921 [Helianthus annuus]KAJ0767775.1 hypothetical protein HanLR1_Chr03g0093301 [Helianthus annuus]